MYVIMSCANRKIYFFLSDLDAFFFFFLFGLIAVAKTSSTLLNRSIESGHLCFVLNLKEKL